MEGKLENIEKMIELLEEKESQTSRICEYVKRELKDHKTKGKKDTKDHIDKAKSELKEVLIFVMIRLRERFS